MRKLIIAVLLVFTTAGTVQSADDADNSFQAGLKAFRSGDYQNALGHFEEARRLGLNRPGLDFNLGVSYYKVQDYPLARDAFIRAATNTNIRPLAYYNLGLVELRLDNRQAATRWFREARAATQNEDLKSLAERMLAKLEGQPGIDTVKTAKAWWLSSVSLNTGYDDNLIDPTDQSGSNTGDGFTELFALTGGPLTGTFNDGIRFDLSAYAIRYQDIDAYNMNVLRGGLSSNKPLGAWQARMGIELEHSTLGDDAYLNGAHLLVSTERIEGDKRLRLRYRASHFTPLEDNYDPLAGQRQQFDVELRKKSTPQSDWRIAYQLELNARDDLATPSTFTSYSPTRHSLRLAGEIPLAKAWTLGGDLRYRVSRYNGDNIYSDGNVVRREDVQRQASLKLRYELFTNWELQLEYNYTHNDSSIDGYDYDRNLYLLGISTLF
jgi:hypothetical protein